MSLSEIAQRAFNTPLLVDPAKAQAFLVGFGARILGGQIMLPTVDVPRERIDRASRVEPRMSIIAGDVGQRRRSRGEALYPVRDGIAIIEVTGTLVHRGAWLGNSSGETSYEGLAAQIEAAASDAAVRGIALEIDTFGGQAKGAFDLADMIRDARASKPVWAFVAETALSAGYVIAAQADRIILPRTGEVGSIGVLTMHVDYSERLADDGIAVSMIHAGAQKVDGNPFEPLPDDVRAELQADVEQIRDIFAATVAAGRGSRLSSDAARATEARVYSGMNAVSSGLADRVSDLRSGFAAFIAHVNDPTRTITRAAISGPNKEAKMAGQTKKKALEAEAEVQEDTAAAAGTEGAEENAGTGTPEDVHEDAGAGAQSQEPSASSPRAVADAAADSGSISRAAAAALADLASMGARLGVKVDLAKELRDGTSPDALRSSILESAAKAADAAQVSTAHAPASAPGDKAASGESPLVKAAKATAEKQRAAKAGRGN